MNENLPPKPHCGDIINYSNESKVLVVGEIIKGHYLDHPEWQYHGRIIKQGRDRLHDYKMGHETYFVYHTNQQTSITHSELARLIYG